MEQITVDNDTYKLKLPEFAVIRSPLKKVPRQGTPVKTVQSQAIALSTHHEDDVSALNNNIDNHTNQADGADKKEMLHIISEMTMLLPKVIETLKLCGRHTEWVNFMRLVSKGEFPLDNIAYQLFLDVVKFYSSSNIHSMRYTKDVKDFWALGYKLFRGKFIRFMGGYKTINQDVTDGRREMSPSKAKINFACPDLYVLRREINSLALKCDRPGILTTNIDVFSIQNQGKSCKLSIDGKKIAPGFGKKLGEVDLFGHEDIPTLEQKQERLKLEKDTLLLMTDLLNKLDQKDKIHINECLDDEKQCLRQYCVSAISKLSQRLRELRTEKVKKEQALNKFKKLASETTSGKAKFTYVLSSLKTALYRIGQCIQDTLHVIDAFGNASAQCTGNTSYSQGNYINLNEQTNYVCLRHLDSKTGNMPKGEVKPRQIKQRSDEWFLLRKKAKLTGSTMYKALGFQTLKAQQAHYDTFLMGKSPPQIPLTLLDAMKHGSENEINAVATLVSKILPSLYPEETYVEEGCEILKAGDKTFMVVSPDGSTLVDNETVKAIEIKCPLPGKQFTTDVHYKVPVYYLCQLLSEMAALKCEQLLFLSYTPESTTVHLAIFDAGLWESLYTTCLELYDTTCLRPKKKHRDIESLRKKLLEYQQNNIDFIAEFPSAKAVPCMHTDMSSFEPHGRHASHSAKKRVSIRMLQDVTTKVSMIYNKSVVIRNNLELLVPNIGIAVVFNCG